MTRKGRERKWSWATLMYSLDIYLDALRGTTKPSAVRNNRTVRVLVSCTYGLLFSYKFADIKERVSLSNARNDNMTGVRNQRVFSVCRTWWSITTRHLKCSIVIDHKVHIIYLSLSIINTVTVRKFKAMSHGFLVKKIHISKILNTNL